MLGSKLFDEAVTSGIRKEAWQPSMQSLMAAGMSQEAAGKAIANYSQAHSAVGQNGRFITQNGQRHWYPTGISSQTGQPMGAPTQVADPHAAALAHATAAGENYMAVHAPTAPPTQYAAAPSHQAPAAQQPTYAKDPKVMAPAVGVVAHGLMQGSPYGRMDAMGAAASTAANTVGRLAPVVSPGPTAPSVASGMGGTPEPKAQGPTFDPTSLQAQHASRSPSFGPPPSAPGGMTMLASEGCESLSPEMLKIAIELRGRVRF